MTIPELTARLQTQFQAIHLFLETVSADDWQRPQGAKWNIAQEMAHLLNATQGTARLFSPAGRTIWKSTDLSHLGRSADEVRTEYQQALATRNPVAPVTSDIEQPTAQEQALAWQAATKLLITNLETTVVEADLDRFTVWKHPLIGIMTAREMLYFTDYHTERHHATLTAKQFVKS